MVGTRGGNGTTMVVPYHTYVGSIHAHTYMCQFRLVGEAPPSSLADLVIFHVAKGLRCRVRDCLFCRI